MTILLARDLPDWADHSAPRDKFSRNAVEIPRYASIERSMTSDAQSVIHRLQTGEIDKRKAMAQFKDALLQHETEAFVAGRRARRDLRPELSPAEEKMLTGRHSRNMRYFSGFCDDVVEGKGKMPYPQRAEAYAKSLWSLYSRGETSDFDSDEASKWRYVWVLDVEAEHCKDCLKRAGESRVKPYTWDELTEIGWPGEKTACCYNCRCHVNRIKPSKAQTKIDEQPPTVAETPSAGIERFHDMLGGPELPNALPAAGVPYVRVQPATLTRIAQRQPTQAARDQVLQSLPLLPQTLARPQSVLNQGDVRIYTRDGIGAAIQRDPDSGRWWLLYMLVSDQLREVQERQKEGSK